MPGYFPPQDADLVGWSNNFSSILSAEFATYGVPEASAVAFATLATNLASAYATATEPSTRTKGTVAAKNQARLAMKESARKLASIIYGQGLTDQQIIDIGLTVADSDPTPQPPPANAPGITVLSAMGWTLKVRLSDPTDSARRGRALGTLGASVFSFVGDEPPTDIAQWVFQGNTGKTRIDVAFPNSLAAGTKVWLAAFWFNGSKQSGPLSAPISANLPGGSVAQAA